MNIVFQSKFLTLNKKSLVMEWPVLQAIEHDGTVFVLLDPDAYLLDPGYKKNRRLGAPAIRNLIALNEDGGLLWEAEFPEKSDYYYRIDSISPLLVSSFSSFQCEIDPNTGSIRKKEFFK